MPPTYPPRRPHRPAHVSRKHSSERRRSALGWLGEIALVLVLALILSTLLRLFVVQVYSIPSASMENTLQIGDRIVVNRIPYLGKQVERGDVIVFQDSQNWMSNQPNNDHQIMRSVGEFLGLVPADGKQVIVKRVIGVGGDLVECCTVDGDVMVNGEPVDETYVVDGASPSETQFAVTVPEGQYWVMGDNRPNSGDSRYHQGEGTEFIHAEDVIGRVQWVIWPFNHWSTVSHREVFADVSSGP